MNPRGFGFVTEDGDLSAARSAFVAPPLLNPFFTDDLVRVDGVQGDTVIVAPPYNASEDELAEIVATLTSAIGDAVASARTA